VTEHSYDKELWRERTFACLWDFPELWTGKGKNRKLSGTFVDLFGHSGEYQYRKFKPYLPHDEKGRTRNYIVIDIDPDVVARAIFYRNGDKVEGHDLPFRLIFGDAYAVVPTLLNDENEKLVCVMFDTTKGINEKGWGQDVDVLRDVVNRATRRVPLFVLGLNHTLSRGGDAGTHHLDRVKFHADKLVTTFREWGLRLSDLLPDGSESMLRNLNELLPSPFLAGSTPEEQYAQVGGFDIYRSGNKVLNMITVRIAFDSRRCTYVWRPDVRAVK
jgi:hypothetical protein